jgi:glyoxylase-like metal-dependent hydrolase (beta-lactamase superfamily II)
MKRFTIPLLCAASLLYSLLAGAQSVESRRQIRHVSGDLYHVEDDKNTFTSVLVTPQGIILTDPIDNGSAAWLKTKLAARFDVPVKYIIYSHHHDDHAPGAEVFDGAIIVAHENVVPALIGDTDNPAIPPHLTFSDRLTIKLGGRQVNLIYLGKTHTDNMIVVHYPAERALLTVDIIMIDRVAYRDLSAGPFYFPGWIDGLTEIESLDFDTLLMGHGIYGTDSGYIGEKEDASRFREYLEALYDKVVAAKQEGMTLEQAVAAIDLPQYSHLGKYDEWFKQNVEGVYGITSLSDQE